MAKYFSHIIKAQYLGLGFWTLDSNWRSNHDVIGLAPTIVDEIDLEDLIILPYCKPKNMQLMLKIVAYTPYLDLKPLIIFLLRLANLELYIVHMDGTI